MMQFPINRGAIPSVYKVGNEQTPILLLDNFIESLEESMLSGLESLSFDVYQTYYPGIRSDLPRDYIMAVATTVGPLIRQLYGVPPEYQTQLFESYYSLVNSAPEDLILEQRLPHVDGFDSYRFALIHYLNPEPHGGTAFYRHLPTGYERITDSNHQHYFEEFDAYHAKYGTPGPAYISQSSGHFEKIGEIPYQQNRLAVYPGNLLHSGSIISEYDISSDPIKGRLTANVFLNFIAS